MFTAGLIPVIVAPFFAVWYYGIYLVSLTNIALLTGGAALVWVAGLMIPKLVSDRRWFCKWIDRHTYRGQPHYCIRCWHLQNDPTAQTCESCSEPIYRLRTKREGVPPPTEDRALMSLMDRSMTTMPNERRRKDLTENIHFIDRRRFFLLEAIAVSLWLAIEGWIIWALIATALGYWIWHTWGVGWMTALKIAAIVALYILVVVCVAIQPWLLRRRVRKYGPYGALPWCLSCNADLHDNLRRDSEGRLKKRCAKCGEQVFEFEVDHTAAD